MGLIEGTIFRIVKIVVGMVQLRFNGSDIVIREELFKEIDYGKHIN
jgi:Fe2+ transport system protein FeoA